MINDYSKNVLDYFNVDRFVETGTWMGETPATILDWGYEGKIDVTEIKEEYCQVSTTFNLLKILGFSNLRHQYNTTYSVFGLINDIAELQFKIHQDARRAYKIQDLGHLIMHEQKHWNFYSLANKAGLNPLPKLDKYNIFKSDTRAFLKTYTRAHDNKNTFFYLDAHWDKDDYPLLEELKILTNISHLNPIIAIDDFKTPGKNHGFDIYEGKVCSAPFIKDIVKEVTDTIYCCPEANFHNRGQAFVFYNRNKKDVQPLLDRYPLIEIPIK
tara:strand:- start:3778 stop:4587 length:810 start_codon:yes stop_codon:yes gene_type:complete